MIRTTYGYARVSARDQNLNRQLDALMAFGVDKLLAEKASSRDFNRPKWKKLVESLREGDTLVVKSIDRLGRNYEEVINEWRMITKEKKASIVVLDMPLLDTRNRHDNITGTLIADIVLQLLSYVAQIERENIRQRQAEGIAAAKARGVKFGRPQKKRPPQYQTVKESYLTGTITKSRAAEQMGVSAGTFGKWIREDAAGQNRNSQLGL